jgi:hypothetical protein
VTGSTPSTPEVGSQSSSVAIVGAQDDGAAASSSDVKSSTISTAAMTSLNSGSSTSSTADFHAGWLTARDAVFAELDADSPLTAFWKRIGRNRRLG